MKSSSARHARKLLVAACALMLIPSFARASNTGTPAITSPAANTLLPGLFRVEGTAPFQYGIELFDGTAFVSATQADTNGKWAMTVGLVTGAHTLSAKSVNVAKERSAASISLPIIVDNAPPVATISTPNNSVFLPPTAGIDLTGTATDKGPAGKAGVGSIRVRYYNAVTAQIAADHNAICAPACDGTAALVAWKDEGRVPTGNYNIVVDAYDRAGNRSAHAEQIQATVITAEVAGDEIITECTGTAKLNKTATCTDTFQALDGRFVSVLLTHGNWHETTDQGPITITWKDSAGHVVVEYGCEATGTDPNLDVTYLGTCNQHGPKADTYAPGTQTLEVTAQATNCANDPDACTFHGLLRLVDATQPV